MTLRSLMRSLSENPLRLLAQAQASARAIKAFWHKSGQLFGGSHVISARGEGFQWADVRPYTYGDETKWMSWKHTARTGEAFIKTFEVERAHRFVLLLDHSISMTGGILQNRFERAWLLSAVVGYLILQQKDVCLTYDSSQSVRRKQLTVHRYDHDVTRWALAQVSRQRAPNPDTLTQQLRKLAESYRRQSSWIVFTDGVDHYESLYTALRLVSQRHELLVVLFPDLFYVSQQLHAQVKRFRFRYLCHQAGVIHPVVGDGAHLTQQWFHFWKQLKLPQIQVRICLPEDNLFVFARKLLTRA